MEVITYGNSIPDGGLTPTERAIAVDRKRFLETMYTWHLVELATKKEVTPSELEESITPEEDAELRRLSRADYEAKIAKQ